MARRKKEVDKVDMSLDDIIALNKRGGRGRGVGRGRGGGEATERKPGGLRRPWGQRLTQGGRGGNYAGGSSSVRQKVQQIQRKARVTILRKRIGQRKNTAGGVASASSNIRDVLSSVRGASSGVRGMRRGRGRGRGRGWQRKSVAITEEDQEEEEEVAPSQAPAVGRGRGRRGRGRGRGWQRRSMAAVEEDEEEEEEMVVAPSQVLAVGRGRGWRGRGRGWVARGRGRGVTVGRGRMQLSSLADSSTTPTSRPGSRLKIIRSLKSRGRGQTIVAIRRRLSTGSLQQTTPTTRRGGRGRGWGTHSVGSTPLSTPGLSSATPLTVAVVQDQEFEPVGVNLLPDFAASHHTLKSLNVRFTQSPKSTIQRMVMSDGRNVQYS